MVDAVSSGRSLWIATCNSIGVFPPELRRRFTGKPERLIRLALDSGWLFDLKGRNLTTTIGLLGDSFDAWLHKRLNFRVSSFTKEDGLEQVYLKVVRPSGTDLSQTFTRTRARLEAKKEPKNPALD